VVRLSGINITVGEEEKPLIIKVASIPNAKLQVYFIDNEDYFQRKYVFHDKQQRFYDDNDERAIFFCKGVIETVKKIRLGSRYRALQRLDDLAHPNVFKDYLQKRAFI